MIEIVNYGIEVDLEDGFVYALLQQGCDFVEAEGSGSLYQHDRVMKGVKQTTLQQLVGGDKMFVGNGK